MAVAGADANCDSSDLEVNAVFLVLLTVGV